MNTTPSSLRRLCYLLIFWLATAAYTQVVPPASGSSAAPATQEAVVLNPFVVTTDTETGYAATNTLDGSRLNTALRDTPASISVFTRDFMDDIGATDIATLLRYDLSSEVEFGDANADGTGNQVGSLDSGTAWRTRGLTGAASTNGFRDAGAGGDLYNVERVGANRGPNAILFGTGASGGVLNLRTKTADPRRNRYSVEGKVGDHDTRRGTFDINRVLLRDRLGIRVLGLVEHKGSYIPHSYSEKLGATLSLLYRFNQHTDFRISFDKGQSRGIGGRPWGMADSITSFLTAVQSGAVRFDPVDERYETANGAVVGASSGVGNLALRTAVIYTPDGLTSTLWEGATAAVNRTTLSSTASVFTGAKPTVPEWVARYNEVNASGASEYGELDHRVFNATFNHRWFNNFYMELAYNFAKRNSDTLISNLPELRADLNYRLPNGTLNPYFYGNGYYFSQQNYARLIRQFQDETFRVSFSYDLDLKRFGQHRFAALGERYINNTVRYRTLEAWEGAPYGGMPEAVVNRVTRRRYFSIAGPLANYGPGHTVEPLVSDSYASNFGSIGRLTSGWVPQNALDINDEITTDSQLFVMQNFLFSRRLVTTLGLRYDTIDTFAPRTVRDATTSFFRFAGPTDQPLFAGTGNNWFEAVTEKGQRRSLGAVFHLTKNFSVTGNASNGIELPTRNRTVLPFDRVPNSYKGEGRDYGLNFTFLDNKISGSFRYFESSTVGENNLDKVQPVFVAPNNDVMYSFYHYFREAGLTNVGSGAPVASIDELTTTYFSEADSYMSDRESNGYEFELVANPTRSWSVRFGYSWTERERSNVLSEGEPWWAERIELWKSLDALYISRTGRPSIYNQLLVDQAGAVTNRTVADRIADSDRELSDVRREEQQGYGNREHKVNLWTRYAFSSARLRGLAVGGGYRFQSKNIAGVDLATDRILYGNPRSLFDLFFQYRTKGVFGRWADRTSLTYQLNVVNLLDDQTINITKMLVDTATGAPYSRRAFREEPRTTAFTVRMDF